MKELVVHAAKEFIRWVFRRKTLTSILYLLILAALSELAAIGSGDDIAAALNKAAEGLTDSPPLQTALGVLATYFSSGSWAIFAATFSLILVISFLIALGVRTEVGVVGATELAESPKRHLESSPTKKIRNAPAVTISSHNPCSSDYAELVDEIVLQLDLRGVPTTTPSDMPKSDGLTPILEYPQGGGDLAVQIKNIVDDAVGERGPVRGELEGATALRPLQSSSEFTLWL